MPSSLEFHDSTLLSIDHGGASVRLRFDAYVHHWDVVEGRWKGTGWVQPVEITLGEGVVPTPPALPIDLAGGVVQLGDVVHDNLVPLPLVASTQATVRLELISGELLEISGMGLLIHATGPGERREDLPDEWAPAR